MAKFTGTDLPQLSNGSDDVAVKKSILDLLDKINTVADSSYPVGATYTQYSGQTAPALLFGGTWTDITATSLPTQVYDSGSNANGYWIRYTDGTMQCWGTTGNITTGSSTTIVAIYIGNLAQSFPQSFSSTPNVTYTPQQVGGYGWSLHVQSVSTSGFIGGILSESNTYTTFLYWTAIGKWSSAPVYPVTLWKRTGGSLTTTTGTSVVTGIYDSGTNSNGSWIRFTDGTMMCWAHIPLTARTLTRATLVSGIGWYEITLPTITFPIPFISQPSITVGGYGNTGNIETIQPYNVTSTTMLYAYQYLGPDAGATTSVSFESDWVATGKWK